MPNIANAEIATGLFMMNAIFSEYRPAIMKSKRNAAKIKLSKATEIGMLIPRASAVSVSAFENNIVRDILYLLDGFGRDY